MGRYKNWRGVIDKPILGLLTFGSNLDFSDFGTKRQIFAYFLDLFKIYSGFEGRYWVGMSGSLVEKLNFQAVIKSAASAASRETKNQGPRSRGAHGRRLGLRTTGLGGSPGSWSLIFGLPGGCASSRLDHGLKV